MPDLCCWERRSVPIDAKGVSLQIHHRNQTLGGEVFSGDAPLPWQNVNTTNTGNWPHGDLHLLPSRAPPPTQCALPAGAFSQGLTCCFGNPAPSWGPSVPGPLFYRSQGPAGVLRAPAGFPIPVPVTWTCHLLPDLPDSRSRSSVGMWLEEAQAL